MRCILRYPNSVAIQSNKSTRVTLDGTEYLYFGGTNYLGLAHRRELFDAAAQAFETFGWSAGASRLTSGENELMLALEQELAQFAGSEAALVLPAGFVSNAAVVDGIEPEVQCWIAVKNMHGSISSALRQSSKRVVVEEADKLHDGKPLRERHNITPDFRLGVFVLQSSECSP